MSLYSLHASAMEYTGRRDPATCGIHAIGEFDGQGTKALRLRRGELLLFLAKALPLIGGSYVVAEGFWDRTIKSISLRFADTIPSELLLMQPMTAHFPVRPQVDLMDARWPRRIVYTNEPASADRTKYDQVLFQLYLLAMALPDCATAELRTQLGAQFDQYMPRRSP